MPVTFAEPCGRIGNGNRMACVCEPLVLSGHFGLQSAPSLMMRTKSGCALNAANPRDLRPVKHSWGRQGRVSISLGMARLFDSVPFGSYQVYAARRIVPVAGCRSAELGRKVGSAFNASACNLLAMASMLVHILQDPEGCDTMLVASAALTSIASDRTGVTLKYVSRTTSLVYLMRGGASPSFSAYMAPCSRMLSSWLWCHLAHSFGK